MRPGRMPAPLRMSTRMSARLAGVDLSSPGVGGSGSSRALISSPVPMSTQALIRIMSGSRRRVGCSGLPDQLTSRAQLVTGRSQPVVETLPQFADGERQGDGDQFGLAR